MLLDIIELPAYMPKYPDSAFKTCTARDIHLCYAMLKGDIIIMSDNLHPFKIHGRRLSHGYQTAKNIRLNPIALRTAKTLWSFGHSECSRVKVLK